jgi:CheY-like chemotaxis protein
LYILIVEDDRVQFQLLRQVMQESKSIAALEIKRISTEKEFYDRFDEIASDKPAVILLDIMLRWADPAPNLELPPTEVDREGFYRAGFRCERRLAADKRTQNIPVIFYSVLEYEDLIEELPQRPQVKYLNKDFDLKTIRKALQNALG